MVEKIYLVDAYRKELEATVTAVRPKEFELDKTIFYPTGGGEPCDTGTILVGDASYNVVDVKKSDESVIHILDSDATFQVGESVKCILNWERRYAHMRYHTAAHVVGGVIEKRYGAMYTGGQIYHDRARFDFDVPNFTREVALEAVKESQRVIDERRDVVAKIISKEEALSIPNLARTEPGMELLKRLETLRIVEIVGFDTQLDGGTHVSNTSEIGKVELSNFENKGSRRKRMEIILK
ncbi:MAG: alanyl-tRNA editing protein [Candidatus Micrarchaeaceae archaeon]|jgi:misacylated tRNA(Ala) deacylase|nr:alanyl-tRNA editing protein [Candidatus Micrarchaeota archaeon]HII09520.1 alanyl-tRNA editing protein [Candidatus Micrarchaeota archaeon]